jgi:hypothetical protein
MFVCVCVLGVGVKGLEARQQPWLFAQESTEYSIHKKENILIQNASIPLK